MTKQLERHAPGVDRFPTHDEWTRSEEYRSQVDSHREQLASADLPEPERVRRHFDFLDGLAHHYLLVREAFRDSEEHLRAESYATRPVARRQTADELALDLIARGFGDSAIGSALSARERRERELAGLSAAGLAVPALCPGCGASFEHEVEVAVRPAGEAAPDDAADLAERLRVARARERDRDRD